MIVVKQRRPECEGFASQLFLALWRQAATHEGIEKVTISKAAS